MATRKPTQMPTEGKVIRLKWSPAEDLPTLYANHLLVTRGETEVYLIFGSVAPPIALSPEELPDEVSVKPVAKIVITPQVLKKIIGALTKNEEAFEEKEESDAG